MTTILNEPQPEAATTPRNLTTTPNTPTSPSITFRYLSEPDVVAAGVLDMARCMDVIEETFSLLGRGDYRMTGTNANSHGAMLDFPERSDIPGMPVSGDDRRFMAMPAYLGGRFGTTGVKWYGSNVENRDAGLPRSIHLLTINDTRTGAPLAIMSANLISAMRTGAVAGVGARHLAAPDAKVVAIVGPGVMGRTALDAFLIARPSIETVRVKGRGRASLDAFTEYVAEHHPGVTVEVVDDIPAAVADADIVTCTTTGGHGSQTYPKLERAWLKPGAFLSMPSYLTVDAALERPDVRLVVDNLGLYQAWAEEVPAPHHENLGIIGCRFLDRVEQGTLALEDIDELGDIVNGEAPGRRSPDEIVLFSIGGMPVEDVAWGTELARIAAERGIGSSLPLWTEPVLR